MLLFFVTIGGQLRWALCLSGNLHFVFDAVSFHSCTVVSWRINLLSLSLSLSLWVIFITGCFGCSDAISDQSMHWQQVSITGINSAQWDAALPVHYVRNPLIITLVRSPYPCLWYVILTFVNTTAALFSFTCSRCKAMMVLGHQIHLVAWLHPDSLGELYGMLLTYWNATGNHCHRRLIHHYISRGA